MINLYCYYIKPCNIVIYSFPFDSIDYLYDASSLQSVPDTCEINDYVKINGLITNKYNISPVILFYSDNTIEIAYFQSSDDFPINSDGNYICPSSNITGNTVIQIPDINNFNQYSDKNYLVSLSLPSPKLELITDFINHPPIVRLTKKISYLSNVIKVLLRRLYQIYPPFESIPDYYTIDNKIPSIITYTDFINKYSNDIINYEIDPLLQPYHTSHHSKDRLITYFTNDGNVFLVKSEYDPKTRTIGPSKK